MSFFELPNVDRYSKFSEQSETSLKRSLNQLNNLICRTDVPDKGCDFDAELIDSASNATNRRFGIQLKSIENPVIVAGKEYISYPFETSRLAYLLNRPIGTGLIVLHDVQQDRCFFDFADAVYKRLAEERPNDDWHMNDKVNIRIPVDQLLDDEKAARIHAYFTQRFKSAELILNSYGARYNYTTIAKPGQPTYDVRNPDDIKRLLLAHGMSFLQDYHDLPLLYQMITQITNQEIVADKHLLIIAAVVYGEVGKYAEAHFYMAKVKRRSDLTADELLVTHYSDLKTRLTLDEISTADFLTAIKALKAKASSAQNLVMLEINISYYELVNTPLGVPVPPKAGQTIAELFTRIQQLEVKPGTRKLLEIWNAENLLLLINLYRKEHYRALFVREWSKIPGMTDQQNVQDVAIKTLETVLFATLDRLFKAGETENDKLLMASVIDLRAKAVLGHDLDLVGNYPMLQHIKPHENGIYRNHIELIWGATNLFSELGYQQHAYAALCYGLELLKIGRMHYHYQLDFNDQELEAARQKLETALELDPYQYHYDQLLLKHQEVAKEMNERPMYHCEDMDDEDIAQSAKGLLATLNLTPQYLPVLIREVETWRLFYLRCDPERVELIQQRTGAASPEEFYGQEHRYALRNKLTNIISPYSADVDQLLKSWGY
ncbi:DUF4365 domain-containing protein [Mucilaginibacter paludis]|uniref:DUF4365 domain-containing protein n=1 Tax=Mucilaginibacter paludis DSM 18603 TaxID=714943 RepID=H1Y3F1_9SPHI|nr:DUF4365 domain-containing protein [Mucilaginibacter paludis]EHQ29719.1 hypothetical protein Mucpa_5650 [Mucilaginibacter paludis DSM 18603]